MNAIPLAPVGGTTPVAYQCDGCRQVHATAPAATTCCVCDVCHLPLRPDERRHGQRHAACAARYYRDERAAMVAAHHDLARIPPTATRLAAADSPGPVCWDHGDRHHEGYFEDLADLRAWCAEREVPPPAWVWVCTEHDLAFDAAAVIEQATEDMHDGARQEAMLGCDELQTLLDEWAEAQAVPAAWHIDDARVVVLDAEGPARPRRGGPEKCPRPCVECGTRHHFSDALMECADTAPDHPAARAGHGAWYECKHCDAWRAA